MDKPHIESYDNIVFRELLIKLMILGDKVKKARKAKGLSQKEVAHGICTQATISQMENHNKVPTMSIFVKICNRLEVSQADITSENDSEMNYLAFYEIDQLCKKRKYQEAYTILTESIDEKKLKNDSDQKKYYYFLGIINLFSLKNGEEALFYFNLALTLDSAKELAELDILLTNNIGIVYELKQDVQKAKVYYDKSLEDIHKIKDKLNDNFDEITGIYFNVAKFYSKCHEYHKAIRLIETGMDISIHSANYHLLDSLLYEKGLNRYKLEKSVSEEISKDYTLSYALGLMNANQELTQVIEQDALEFGINSFNFF